VSDRAFFQFYENTVMDGCIANDASQVMLDKSASVCKIAEGDGSVERDMVCDFETVDGGQRRKIGLYICP
jgi:hypothetical protein